MIRTQVLLEENQHRYLKEKSRETGASLSELIRQAVDRMSASDAPLRQRALAMLGSFQADRDDVSVQHDECFAAAAEDDA
jgi:hypothetical protein